MATIPNPLDTSVTEISFTDKSGNPKELPTLITPAVPPSRFATYWALTKEVWEKVAPLHLKKGDRIRIHWEQGNPKKPNPQYPSDYYWNIVAIERLEVPSPSSAPAGARPGSPASGPERQQQAPQQSTDARGDSIERQVALKEARQAATDFWQLVRPLDGDTTRDAAEYIATVEVMYGAFLRLLQGKRALGASREQQEGR